MVVLSHGVRMRKYEFPVRDSLKQIIDQSIVTGCANRTNGIILWCKSLKIANLGSPSSFRPTRYCLYFQFLLTLMVWYSVLVLVLVLVFNVIRSIPGATGLPASEHINKTDTIC